MKSQDEFVDARRKQWEELDALVVGDLRTHALDAQTISRLATLYRSTCSDLMRARSGAYDAQLLGYLDGLTARTHNALYGARPVRIRRLFDFVIRTFPRATRANWRFFATSSALFYVPLLLGVLAAIMEPSIATSILPKGMLDGAAQSYADALEGRASGTDAAMSGHYVHNNVGIAFQCFATGVLLGFGSIFFLVYNGVVIGIVLGWVIAQGNGENIGTFVCGHGPFELTGICISGAAGLRMGYSLVRTHGLTRVASLRAAGADLGAMVGGAALYLFAAAAIEGFWSPSAAPREVKWAVGAALSGLVIAHLGWSGRTQRPARAGEIPAKGAR